MADVAQLVRALDCGSGGRGFKSHHSPQEINRGESCNHYKVAKTLTSF